MRLIDAGVEVIVVEGLFVLLNTGAWAKLRPLMDLTIYVSVTRSVSEATASARKARTNGITCKAITKFNTFCQYCFSFFPSDEEALQHYQRVDGPNYDLIASQGSNAQLVLEYAADHRIAGVSFN
jgi:uridine kinase